MRKRALLTVAALALAMTAANTATAPAEFEPMGLTGLQVVERTSPTTVSARQEVMVSCPTGTRVYSAGGQVNSPAGHAVIERIEPLRDLSGVVVTPGSGSPLLPGV